MVVVALSLVAAGCGDDDDDATETADTTAAQTEDTAGNTDAASPGVIRRVGTSGFRRGPSRTGRDADTATNEPAR